MWVLKAKGKKYIQVQGCLKGRLGGGSLGTEVWAGLDGGRSSTYTGWRGGTRRNQDKFPICLDLCNHREMLKLEMTF